MEMRWTRGGGAVAAGDIKWGVAEQEGGRAQRLLLLFQVTSAGQKHPRHQAVELDWNTPAGKPSRLPVLLCPFCERRCRFLCAAYPGRQGGPYLGEFACRQCAGLCYVKQLEYQSAWSKNFDTLMNLSAKMRLHPGRVTEADFEKMDRLTENPLGHGSRTEKLLIRLEGRAEKRNQASGLEKLENPRLWDLLPPPVFTPPKRRGRPSPKRDRQQARACAKLLRDAQKEAAPKRPAGRPKERRDYNGSSRAAGGCAGRLAAGEGYCVGCREGRQIVEASVFTASNGRAGIKGKCAECGRGLCRMGAAFSAQKVQRANDALGE